MSKLALTQRNEIFNQSVEAERYQSRYDLSSRSSGSFRMGVLYPIYCRNDIHPGDKFSLSCAPFVRFLPLVSPALTNVDVEIRYFFVPRRILWSQWKNFISPSTGDDVKLVEPFVPNYEKPQDEAFIYNVAGSLYDYMGVASIPWNKDITDDNVFGARVWVGEANIGHGAPAKRIPSMLTPSLNDPLKYSLYPYLAYNAIWNEYFRDENLQDFALQHVTTPGAQHPSDFFLRRVNWSKDYFTGGLPWVTQQIFSTPSITQGDTIEDLREASALTRWLELQAIGGHRYQESILTHFGVHVPDEAAEVPVYLGGGKCPVQIGSVEQNGPQLKLSDPPLGTLAGRATASDSMFIDKFMFKEHGTIIGVMYIRPHALYADVTPKDMFPKDRHDYMWPSFVNLGDEAVKSTELNPGWCELNNPDADHSYQMRYASLRTSFDQVHGELRPLEPLESWTQARSWSDVSHGTYDEVKTPIQIESSFIECKPSNRIFAVTDDVDNLIGEITTFVDAIRPLPNYVDPKID